MDTLTPAERALRASSPRALAATFEVMRSVTVSDMAAAQEMALNLNQRLLIESDR